MIFLNRLRKSKKIRQTQNPFRGMFGVLFRDQDCNKELTSMLDMKQHKEGTIRNDINISSCEN